MILLTKLLLAHLLGDFIFQTDQWIRDKEEKKLRSVKLYIHALVHGLIVFVLAWDIAFWMPALVIAVSHLLIDAMKLLFQQETTKRRWFLIDQLLHLFAIVAVWYSWTHPPLPQVAEWNGSFWLYLTAVVALTTPTSVVVKMIISKWAPQAPDDGNSLQSAGKYIGILERLFVFMFLTSGHWEAIGFLITAKSVFRFGDLKESKDRKLTEYILIGTLLSVGIAMMLGTFVLLSQTAFPR